ncbi:MAG: hypothetical protein ABI361_00375 [Nitrososphaera sp.]
MVQFADPDEEAPLHMPLEEFEDRRVKRAPVTRQIEAIYRYEENNKQYIQWNEMRHSSLSSGRAISTYLSEVGNSRKWPTTAEHEFTKANLDKLRKHFTKATQFYIFRGPGAQGITNQITQEQFEQGAQ